MDATIKNATTCELKGTDDLNNCKEGFPFPIPKSGAVPTRNHKLKWRGESVTRYNNQMIVQQTGDYQPTKIIDAVSVPYASIMDTHAITSGHGEYLDYRSSEEDTSESQSQLRMSY